LGDQPSVAVAADAAGNIAGIRYRVQGIRKKRIIGLYL
jgi:hypothetical protein